jgi:hypothetical protein
MKRSMKKKLLATAMVAVVAAIAGYNVYQGQSDVQLSDVQLANVEALAEGGETIDGGELPGVTITCSQANSKGLCWRCIFYPKGYYYCQFTGSMESVCPLC